MLFFRLQNYNNLPIYANFFDILSLICLRFWFVSSATKVKKSEKTSKSVADLHTRIKSSTFAA